MKTYLAPVKEIEKKWYVVDAKDKILGRLATEIASRLRGKHKPTFSPFIDNGDFIIVTNADKDPAHRQQVGRQKILPSYRIHGRHQGNNRQRTAGKEADGSGLQCRKRHASEKQNRPGPAEEAQSLQPVPIIRTQAQQPEAAWKFNYTE